MTRFSSCSRDALITKRIRLDIGITAKRANSWTIVSLVSSIREKSYLPALEVQKEKNVKAEIERAF
jgi:hypothetical protein